MSKFKKFLEIINDTAEHGKKQGIVHLSTNGEALSEHSIKLGEQKVVNFGSCSYLGLEFDERIIEGAKRALTMYGSQFSSSRAYVSLGLYDELEALFGEIFEGNCVVTPTTTLGHLAAIPVLVDQGDAIIIDHQVHNSVQMTIAQLRDRGVYTEVVKHNNFEGIEERIIHLQERHQRIWYMADGIYSMYGDSCPVIELERLLDKHEAFYAYVDDAHGMSCFGKNGRGYVLSQISLHPKMVLAVSLAKAFATGGGVLVFKNESWARLVRNCGGPLLFSGPLQPANLGAAVASAKIHLSDDLKVYQKELLDNIKYTKELIVKLGLPCMSLKNNSPIFFITMSLQDLTCEAIKLLIARGYYVNLGVFPGVPLQNTGIRFTITRLHTKEQISGLLYSLKEILDGLLVKYNFSYKKIYDIIEA